MLVPQDTGACTRGVPCPFSTLFCAKPSKQGVCSHRSKRDGNCSCFPSKPRANNWKARHPFSEISAQSAEENSTQRLCGGRRAPQRIAPCMDALSTSPLHQLLSQDCINLHLAPDLFTQCLRSTSSSASHLRVKKGCFLLIISPSKKVVRVGYS